MTFKVQVRPALMSIHQGHTLLISEQDIGGQKGFYFFDTRVVRSWAIYANGGAPFADFGHGSLLNQLPELYAAFARDGTTFRIHPRQRAAGLGGLIGCHADPGPLRIPARCAAQ